MARRNIIEHSDEEEMYEHATSPPASPVKHKGDTVGSDESDGGAATEDDDDASMADFIDDRALDKLSEHSGSAEEGFSEVEDVDRTPPVTPRLKKQYPVDSDDEGVKEAENFEADLVESPKKRRSVNTRVFKKPVVDDDDEPEGSVADDVEANPIASPKKRGSVEIGTCVSKKPAVEDVDEPESDASDSMDVSPLAKKSVPSTPLKKSMPSTPSRKVLVVHDSDSESVQEVENPKDTKKAVIKKGPVASNKSTPAQEKKSTAKKTPVSWKKTIKSKEVISDTDDDAIAALKLDKDDGMYPECKPSKVQNNNLKRGLPITPPLATRSFSKVVTQHATPSKRQRTVEHTARSNDEDTHATTRPSPKKSTSVHGKKTIASGDAEQDEALNEDAVAHAPSNKSNGRRGSKKIVADEVEDQHTKEHDVSEGKTHVKSSRKITDNSGDTKPSGRAKSSQQKSSASPTKSASALTQPKPPVKEDNVEEHHQDHVASQKKKAAASTPRSVRKSAPAEESKSGSTANRVDEESQEKTKASPKKVAGSVRTKVEDESDPFNAPPAEKRQQAAGSSLSSSEVKTEPVPAASLFEPPQPKRSPAAAAKQTYSSKVWVALPPPEECDVYDINLLDDSLSSRKSYVGLENLRSCELVNAGQLFTGIETSRIRFSAWQDHLSPEMFEIVVALMAFQSDGRYVNPSRISLAELAARFMTETRHEVTKDGRTAICIALGAVRESALVGDLGTSFLYHALRIVLHSYEHERLAAALGALARRSSLVTQIWNSAITFGTKTQNTKSAKPDVLPSTFYNSYQSPKKKRAGAVGGSTLVDHIGALEYDDIIPVYDARNLEQGFEWNAAVFANPAHYFPLFPFSEFPEFGGEIPPNSLVTVGYVTQIYRMPDTSAGKNAKGKSKAKEEVEPAELRVNMMIRFVFVLAVIN